MKIKAYYIKSIILVFTVFCAQFCATELLAQPPETHHITVNNASSINLMPTAEGLSQGCIGGGLPPFFLPITPHSERDVGLIFFQYLPECRFDVLPAPNIITYAQACHNVKAGDYLIFSGATFATLQCKDVSSKE